MREKRVVVRIKGGLGNQLFCYAAARRLAMLNHAELVIDYISGFAKDKLYSRKYQLDHFNVVGKKIRVSKWFLPLYAVKNQLLERVNRLFPFNKRTYLTQEGVDFDSRLMNFKIHGSLYLDGYWQSESYFSDIRSIILEDIQLKLPLDEASLALEIKISQCMAIAVHVRFFDEPNQLASNNLISGYYDRAVELIKKHAPGAHFFIFSDRPELAMSYLSLPVSDVTLITHNGGGDSAYIDLWLMSKCKHFIIANSTFSWWGAWLGRYVDKKVISPGFEKRKGVSWWGFNGLLPDNWIKL
ncbi:MAG: alpha-1,2-fucosyltransferase [Polynucleobacter sp.]|nr:alpha-1,2-fucosyltransferase [Polynucleobacter sp.]